MEFDAKHGGLPPINSVNKPKKNYKWVYVSLIALLLMSNGALLYYFTRDTDSQDNTPLMTSADSTGSLLIDGANQNLSTHYNSALAKLDQLSMSNSMLERQLQDKNSEISQLKSNIEDIIKDKNASADELKSAFQMINDLNGKINFYNAEIKKYQKENQRLTEQNTTILEQNKILEQEKKTLNDQLENKKIFSANNIRILPIELRRGGNEKETSKARRVDILRIKFDINENNLVSNGSHVFYLRIVDPTGQVLYNTSAGSGTFRLYNSSEELTFTKSKMMHFTHSEPVNGLTIDWDKTDDYPKGDYSVELYHQGHLIGQKVCSLR